MTNSWTNPLRFLVSSLIVILTVFAGTASANTEKLSPTLAQRIGGGDNLVKVVAFLNTEKQTLMKKSSPLPGMVRTEAIHAQLISELKRTDIESSPFVNFLRSLADSGQVSKITAYWIADVVSFTVESKLLDQISNHPDLHYLVEDQPLQLIDPVSVEKSVSGLAGSDHMMAITGVRTLWNKGYTGRGRLVCSFDTGVEGTHPALAGRWLGNNGGTASQSWFDPYGTSSPVDKNGHGTHTMGIMVGRDGADTIGVAFNASWMSASVIDRGQSLNKTVSDIIAAFQWAADPDGNPQTVDDLPDVVSNSWGIPRGLFAPCDQTFWQAIDNLEALGVVVIFACGNEGPNPATIRNPADRTSSPTNSFSIGAVNQNQSDLPIASFSSRGPATCDSTKIKPEIVAPGVTIRSSFKDSTYKTISGTSMAAPFVAGCVALMREYNPDATVEEIKNALIQSASDLGAVGKDNNYGWGFINVERALNYLPQPQKPKISVAGIRLAQATDGILAVGKTTKLELELVDSVVSVDDLWCELRSKSGHASILVDSVLIGSIAAGASADNFGDPFMVKVDSFAQLGAPVSFTANFFSKQHGYLNGFDFELVLGQPVIAASIDLSSDRLDFEVTNFGVSRRLQDAASGINPLAHLSFMIADRQNTVYDAMPGNSGFLATEALTRHDFSEKSEIRTGFKTIDDKFEISQVSSIYSIASDQGFVLLDYSVKNSQTSGAESCFVALALDADFAEGESLLVDGNSFIFRDNSSSNFVGIRLLSVSALSAQAVSGALYKSGGLNESQKYGLVSSGQTNLSSGYPDCALIVSVGPFMIDGGGKIEVGAVIASGSSIEEIRVALQRGGARYNQATGTDDDNNAALPESFSLEQNYPNPFNAETRIGFSLSAGGDYRFEIYNGLGRLVKSISNHAANAGPQDIRWDGKDNGGQDVASGVYFYRISFSGQMQTRKMVLLK
jgi:subtilisin family serine protease